MWIGRRPDNSIYGAWTVRQPDDSSHQRQEMVADDHPELLAFRDRYTPIDLSDVDNIEKSLRVLSSVMADWAGKTKQELKASFKAKWNALP